MAYVESEVIVKHATNPSGMGIILRGIDRGRAPRVLDIERDAAEGKVDWLEHPERDPDRRGRDDARGAAAGAPTAGKSESRKRQRRAERGGRPAARRNDARPAVPGILLGEELFEHTLRVFVGSDVDIACPMCGVGPTGPMPKLKPFRVAGHFYTGMYEFDSKLAYVSLADAQKFLGMPGEVTGIEVRTTSPEAARRRRRRDRRAASGPATTSARGRS